MSRADRGTLLLETGTIISHQDWPGQQWVLRIAAPRIAARARPGSFVHVECDPLLPMRRPISIQRVDPQQGWIELLYKVAGEGTRLLATRVAHDALSLLGPIGQPFAPMTGRTLPLLIGGGVGIPPMIFLADHLRLTRDDVRPLVIMGSELPFPFATRASTLAVSGLPDTATMASSMLEHWGIASRLASLQDYAGCFRGYVTDLARAWLDSLDSQQRQRVQVFSCGPTPMLKAVAALARDYDLPCQVSLEEYMACAVGGCAGCTVPVTTRDGIAMRRVCVDGPVFDAPSVFF